MRGKGLGGWGGGVMPFTHRERSCAMAALEALTLSSSARTRSIVFTCCSLKRNTNYHEVCQIFAIHFVFFFFFGGKG